MELRRKCPSWPFCSGFAFCTLYDTEGNLIFIFILLWASAKQRLETVPVVFFLWIDLVDSSAYVFYDPKYLM